MSVETTIARTHDVMCLDLDHPSARKPSVAGGKASSLAELRAQGERVPEGLVVPPGIDADLAAKQAVERFGDRALAVRSSSVAEDLEGASYAGQYVTVLDVRGRSAVAEAVVAVRTSARDAASRGYGRTPEAPMAALIMPMIEAEAAGVAFSTNPVTGEDEVVVEAVIGLAERYVDGEVTPHRWVVDREGRPREEAGGEPAIEADRAAAIAALARRIAELRGQPQDIEWALSDGTIHLLQARPITALPVAPTIDVSPTETWTREDNTFFRPPRPLEFATVMAPQEAASRALFEEVGFPADSIRPRLISGWNYTRFVPLMDQGKDGGKTPPAWLFGLVLRLIPALRRRMRAAAEAIVTDIGGRAIEEWESTTRERLRRATLALRDVNRGGLGDAALADHFDAIIAHLADTHAQHFRLSAVASTLSIGRLGVFVERRLGWDHQAVFDLVQGSSAVSTEGGRALTQLAREIEDDPDALALLRSDPSALVTHSGPGGRALRGHLERHGHIIVGFDLAHPTVAEEPASLLTLLSRQIGAKPRREVDDDRAELAERRAHEARSLLASDPEALATFEARLEEARSRRGYVDETELPILEALALVRYVALEAGRRLSARGLLDRGEDVLFLTDSEIPMALRTGELALDMARRRGEHRWAESHQPPRLYGPEPPAPPDNRHVPRHARELLDAVMWAMTHMEPPPREAPSDGGLCGIPASPGRVTGPVRVVRDPSEFHRIHPGDVLVCPSTKAAWSVVFPLVSAVVTEHGGPLSHPATLAREFGIPAVVGLHAAMKELGDGEIVEVDGATGAIRRIDPG